MKDRVVSNDQTAPDQTAPDQTGPTVDYEDVDDVIAIAERMRADEANRLTPEELAEIGAELGIPAEYVDRARQKLRERRAHQEREAKQAARLRTKIAVIAGALILCAGAIFGLWSSFAVSSLRDAFAEVERTRAQVDNIRARKTAIEQQFEGRGPSLEKDAQLVGAQNRLRVELKRFNEAAAQYNRRASSFPASLWTGGPNLPVRVDMATTAD